MAEYLFNNDQSTLPGNQNVTTYTVGFDADFPLLEDTATKGGGSYYTANDTASLTSAFQNIVQEILDTSATFTSPTVAVNAFNRTQNLNDLLITVFKPTDSLRWPGNVKKYRLDPTTGNIEMRPVSTPLILRRVFSRRPRAATGRRQRMATLSLQVAPQTNSRLLRPVTCTPTIRAPHRQHFRLRPMPFRPPTPPSRTYCWT